MPIIYKNYQVPLEHYASGIEINAPARGITHVLQGPPRAGLPWKANQSDQYLSGAPYTRDALM